MRGLMAKPSFTRAWNTTLKDRAAWMFIDVAAIYQRLSPRLEGVFGMLSLLGADPAKVREALMGGFASSRILEVHGERMIKRTFNPGFRIALHQKDLNLALQSAKAMSLALPNTANTAQLMQAAAAQGWDQLDHSALVRALEVMGNHEVGSTTDAA